MQQPCPQHFINQLCPICRRIDGQGTTYSRGRLPASPVDNPTSIASRRLFADAIRRPSQPPREFSE
jgi:hypothetical protein